MSFKSKMTIIADKIRTLLGITETMGLDAMAENIQTAQTKVDAQNGLIAQISDVLKTKAAGIIPNGTKGITENGMHDVTEYAAVDVNVPINFFASGVNAISSGTFTFESDHVASDGYLYIEHGLGKIPNFFFVFADSLTVAKPWPVGTMTSMYGARHNVNCNNSFGENTDYQFYLLRNYIHKDGYMAETNAWATDSSRYCTQNSIKLSPSTLQDGVTYGWICGHTDYLTN